MPKKQIQPQIEERLTFNSGYLDFGTLIGLVDIESITFDITFAEKELRTLNSIKMRAHKRSTTKCGIKAKVKSINEQVLLQSMGTSAVDGAGHLLSIKDGQYTALFNPVFTAYIDDNVLKPIQFQISDAIIIASPFNAITEDYGTMDLDIVAKDVTIFTYDTLIDKTIAGKITTEATP